MISNHQQGDLYYVVSDACWLYEWDGDKILINERYPLEELHSKDVVVCIETKKISMSEVYGVESIGISQAVNMMKVIPPSGKIGWLLSRHLKKL